jgi:hypothetical protein
VAAVYVEGDAIGRRVRAAVQAVLLFLPLMALQYMEILRMQIIIVS